MLEILPYCLIKNGQPYRFEAVLDEEHCWIKLPAQRFDDLKWDNAIMQLSTLSDHKKVILQLDLGLEEGFNFDFESEFSHYMVAIEEMNKKILTPYQEKIEAVVFYKGTCFLENICEMTEDEIQDHLHKNFDALFLSQEKKRLAALNILGSLSHRLVAFINDQVMSCMIFDDAHQLTPIQKAIYFSKERFDHIFVAIENHDFQYTTLDLGQGLSPLGYISKKHEKEVAIIKLALLLPSDSMMTYEAYTQLENTMHQLHNKTKSYRVVCEKIFNDCWNDLDQVIYNDKSIHLMTMRMIRGFEASGGQGFIQEKWLTSSC